MDFQRKTVIRVNESFAEFSQHCQMEDCLRECIKANCPRIYRPPKIKPIAWREKSNDGYMAYLNQHDTEFASLICDREYLASIESDYPDIDAKESIRRASKFWRTQDGWKHKLKSMVRQILWRETYKKSCGFKFNQIRKKRGII